MRQTLVLLWWMYSVFLGFRTSYGGCVVQMSRIPLRQSVGEGSKMGYRGYRSYGGGNCVLCCSWMFSGSVGIYRRKKYVSGRPRGPQDRGARPIGGGGALPSRGRLGCFLTCTPSPLDHVRSNNHASEGFIPFGLRLIFLFFKILK